MNALVELQQRIELTNEAMSRIGRMLKDSPHSRGLLVNLETLTDTHRHLSEEYDALARESGVEVCTYRLFPDGLVARQNISGIGRALTNFQALFSITYEAVKTDKPKRSQQVSDDIAHETSLEFAYSFPGSVGLALTVPSQASLYGNFFDATIEQIFGMARSSSSVELKAFSRKLGTAPIRALYKWAHDLASAGFGVDVHWKGSVPTGNRLFVQMSELLTLSSTILATGDEEHTDLTALGILEGVDIPTKSFHFKYVDPANRKNNVRGKYIDAIIPNRPVRVPGQYRAVIRRTSRINFSLDQDETEYVLLKLEGLKNAKKKPG